MNSGHENQKLNKKMVRASRRAEKIIDELSEFIDQLEEINADAEMLDLDSPASTYPGLNFLTLRNALCSQKAFADQTWVPKYLSTLGAGPWEAVEFDEFLQGYGFDLYSMPSAGIECVIVGALDWDEDVLSEQIYNRTAKDLKVYTQELFVLGLIVGQDPYVFLEQEAIDEVGEKHSAIKYILEREFTWPSWPTSGTGTHHVGEKFIGIDWAKESVLKAMGYSASVNGPDVYARQVILSRAFEQDFPPGLVTSEQRERWGPKKSADRLYAISHFLSWLISFQGTDKPAAKAKWERDLDWLKRTYYSRTMKFVWPGLETAATPKPAWPFSSDGSHREPKRVVVSTEKPPISEVNLKRPSNALARIIGVSSITYQEALAELKRYISDRNLDFDGLSIRCDQPLFALSGKASLRGDELSQLVASNLH